MRRPPGTAPDLPNPPAAGPIPGPRAPPMLPVPMLPVPMLPLPVPAIGSGAGTACRPGSGSMGTGSMGTGSMGTGSMGTGINGGARGPGIGPAAGGLGSSGAVPGGLRMAGRSGRIGARRRGYGRPVVPTRTGPPTVTGRWSLLPERDPDPTRRSHAVVQALLDRHGIVTRGSVVGQRVPGGVGALYPVLRAMAAA